MREICLIRLDKNRPALILTRAVALPHLHKITVAPITGTIRGLLTEVLVGPDNGLDKDSAVSCDNIQTVWQSQIGRHIGYLLPRQEAQLAAAINTAFDLYND